MRRTDETLRAKELKRLTRANVDPAEPKAKALLQLYRETLESMPEWRELCLQAHRRAPETREPVDSAGCDDLDAMVAQAAAQLERMGVDPTRLTATLIVRGTTGARQGGEIDFATMTLLAKAEQYNLAERVVDRRRAPRWTPTTLASLLVLEHVEPDDFEDLKRKIEQCRRRHREWINDEAGPSTGPMTGYEAKLARQRIARIAARIARHKQMDKRHPND